MTAPARPGLGLIQGEYDELVAFGAGADLNGDGALTVASICLVGSGSADERIQQLRLAGALVAFEIERLLTSSADDDEARRERLRQGADL